MSLTLFFDGGSRGNPGIAGAGWYLSKDDEAVASGWHYVGDHETNNVSEYTGLVEGLKGALPHVASNDRIEIKGDSQLVIRQMRGEYRVKSEKLRPLHQEACALVLALMKENPRLKVVFTHIPRALNSKADALGNRAMDLRSSGFL